MKRVLVFVSLIISLLTLSSNVNASTHFVLVHGAGHGAWWWYKVATLLKSTGHNVTTLDLAASGINPSQIRQVNGSVIDYAKPLTDFMSSLPPQARVVLVGHSLGGLSISLAIERFPHKTSAAVFVTAYMPGPNLSFLTIFEEFLLLQNTRRLGSFMDSQYIFDQGPNNPPTALILGPNFLSSKLYQLSPPEDLVLALSLLRPLPLFNNKDLVTKQVKLTKQRYGSVPRVFIVCDQDHTQEESFQRWMIKRNPPREVKVINGTDHMPMFTKPLKLFSYLGDIAEKYS